MTTPTPGYRPSLAAVLHNSLEELPSGQDTLPVTIPSADPEVAVVTVSGGGSASASSGEESGEEESAETPAVEEEEEEEVVGPTSEGSGEREAGTTKPEHQVTQGTTDVALIVS